MLEWTIGHLGWSLNLVLMMVIVFFTCSFIQSNTRLRSPPFFLSLSIQVDFVCVDGCGKSWFLAASAKRKTREARRLLGSMLPLFVIQVGVRVVYILVPIFNQTRICSLYLLQKINHFRKLHQWDTLLPNHAPVWWCSSLTSQGSQS